MILISNRQRDDIVRYLDLLCNRLNGRGSKEFNTRRLARLLIKALQEKQPLPEDIAAPFKKISRGQK